MNHVLLLGLCEKVIFLPLLKLLSVEEFLTENNALMKKCVKVADGVCRAVHIC